MPRVETDNYWMPPEGWAGHAAPTPKPVPSRDRRRVSEGKSVELHSLKARPELNGRFGVVQSHVAETGRWAVLLGVLEGEEGSSDQEVVTVKSENLEAWDEAGAWMFNNNTNKLTDVYRRLIDATRLRVYDIWTRTGEQVGALSEQYEGGDNGLLHFFRVVNEAKPRGRWNGGFLPRWWSKKHTYDCARYSYSSSKDKDCVFNVNLSSHKTCSEIQKDYGDGAKALLHMRENIEAFYPPGCEESLPNVLKDEDFRDVYQWCTGSRSSSGRFVWKDEDESERETEAEEDDVDEEELKSKFTLTDERRRQMKLIDRVCILCEKIPRGQKNTAYKCARCKNVYYCSRACQKRHWADHKVNCLIGETASQWLILLKEWDWALPEDIKAMDLHHECLCLIKTARETSVKMEMGVKMEMLKAMFVSSGIVCDIPHAQSLVGNVLMKKKKYSLLIKALRMSGGPTVPLPTGLRTGKAGNFLSDIAGLGCDSEDPRVALWEAKKWGLVNEFIALDLIVSYDINLVGKGRGDSASLKDGKLRSDFEAREVVKREIEESKPGHWSRFVRTRESIREHGVPYSS